MKQFPQTALFRQLKLFGKYGVLKASHMLPMITMKLEETVDMDSAAEHGDESETVWDFMFKNLKTGKSYETRMRGVIVDSSRFGYL